MALWASHVFHWRSRPVWAVTFASSAMALLHVYYGRETASFAEVCVRIVVFYVLCFVRYHALVCRVSCDAAAHAFVGPHVCLNVLFVQRYELLCAVAVTAGMVCRLCVGDKKYSAWSERRRRRTTRRGATRTKCRRDRRTTRRPRGVRTAT